MSTDRRLASESTSSPHADAGAGGHLRELGEALTALGHYLAAANHILIQGMKPDTAEALREVLASSMVQYERAIDAACQLRKL